jgi:hypothetical protein
MPTCIPLAIPVLMPSSTLSIHTHTHTHRLGTLSPHDLILTLHTHTHMRACTQRTLHTVRCSYVPRRLLRSSGAGVQAECGLACASACSAGASGRAWTPTQRPRCCARPWSPCAWPSVPCWPHMHRPHTVSSRSRGTEQETQVSGLSCLLHPCSCASHHFVYSIILWVVLCYLGVIRLYDDPYLTTLITARGPPRSCTSQGEQPCEA